jgi:hypothetical protein
MDDIIFSIVRSVDFQSFQPVTVRLFWIREAGDGLP